MLLLLYAILTAAAFMPFSYCFTSSVGKFTQSLHDFSCSTDEISFQLDLSTDKFGGDTSWTVINISNGIMVEEGLWYQSNQVYTENRCLPCGFYNFTIHDSFGDGLTIGNDGGYNITIDKKLVKMNSGTSFSSETTVFHGGAQCPDISLAPSSSPTILTCEDDEIAFQLDLSTDTFGGETSWTIINAYTGVMVEQELWYQSNQIYTENRCLPCGLYNFTIHDSFGDGLIMGKNGGYNISIDNELIKMNSGTSFSSETTVFHGGAQCPDISLAPSTAPEVVTCKDNESKFQFDLTTDAYGHETSWTLSKTNDGSIIEHGGNYQSGQRYIVTICLPCGLNQLHHLRWLWRWNLYFRWLQHPSRQYHH